MCFDTAWDMGMVVATRDVKSPWEREDWLVALQWARDAYRRSYLLQGQASALTADLADVPDRHRGHLVA